MKHSMLSCMRSRFFAGWASLVLSKRPTSAPGVAFDLTQNHIYYRAPNNL